jgi:hypothetical protein
MDQSLRDASFIPQDSRSNFKNVIAKRSDLAKYMGGRMVTPGTDTVYEAGLVLGQVTTAVPDQYKLKPYASGNTDGSQIPVCVLAESTLVSATSGEGSKVLGIIKGTLLRDLLIGMDANAIAVLAARAFVEAGTNLLEI